VTLESDADGTCCQILGSQAGSRRVITHCTQNQPAGVAACTHQQPLRGRTALCHGHSLRGGGGSGGGGEKGPHCIAFSAGKRIHHLSLDTQTHHRCSAPARRAGCMHRASSRFAAESHPVPRSFTAYTSPDGQCYSKFCVVL
jgi:hypothetical protein